MPFNGSGVATPPGADFPAVANTLIESAKFNAVINDAYTCISTAITKDGQTTVTANIPFSNFRLTGVGNASAATDAMNLRSVVNGSGVYVGTVGGTANAITLTANPAIAAYAVGQAFRFIVGTTNTGAVTIATSGLAVRDLKKRVSGGLVAVVANDLIAGNEYAIYDDGTQYVLEGVRVYSHGADIASASTINLDTATGDCVDITGTTSVTAITLAEGEERTLRFTGILTFTNGASLVLPGGANITTAAGDFAVVRGYASGVVRCVSYTTASGAPIVNNAIPKSTVTTAGDLIYGTGSATVTRLGIGTARQVLTVNSGATAPAWANPITLGTPTAASGSTISYTSVIPAGARRMTLNLTRFSSNGTSPFLVQLGVGGTYTTSGYLCAASNRSASTASTAGFILISASVAANTYGGSLILSLADSSNNKWCGSGIFSRDDGIVESCAGDVALSGAVDSIRITTVGGADTFDAGAVNISYE